MNVTYKDVQLASLFFGVLFVILLLIGTKANSQEAPPGMPCGPTQSIDGDLETKFGETITAGGVVGNMFMYITTNPEKHSFTILVRRPDGMSCIVMGGEGFALAEPAKKKGKGL